MRVADFRQAWCHGRDVVGKGFLGKGAKTSQAAQVA